MGSDHSGSQADGATRFELDPPLEAAGFNVAGVLCASDYDGIVPCQWRSSALLADARSAVVLGCGGRAFGDAFEGSVEARRKGEDDPVDRFTARAVEAAVERIESKGHSARALFYWEQRQDAFADFVALGRACGLGSGSRLGMLLHPEFGPWISIRAFILTSTPHLRTPPLEGPEPCFGCPAPCSPACPGGALALGAFDVAACSRTTLSVNSCRQRCAARRACVIGGGHTYSPSMEQTFRTSVVRALERARS